MSHKTELVTLITGVFASTFANDLIEKMIITTISMLVATTIAFYWKKYLERKNKRNE